MRSTSTIWGTIRGFRLGHEQSCPNSHRRPQGGSAGQGRRSDLGIDQGAQRTVHAMVRLLFGGLALTYAVLSADVIGAEPIDDAREASTDVRFVDAARIYATLGTSYA